MVMCRAALRFDWLARFNFSAGAIGFDNFRGGLVEAETQSAAIKGARDEYTPNQTKVGTHVPLTL